MTKKHYERIAKALAAIRPSENQAQERDMWNTCRYTIAECMAEDNPRFVKQVFYIATMQ